MLLSDQLGGYASRGGCGLPSAVLGVVAICQGVEQVARLP